MGLIGDLRLDLALEVFSSQQPSHHTDTPDTQTTTMHRVKDTIQGIHEIREDKEYTKISSHGIEGKDSIVR